MTKDRVEAIWSAIKELLKIAEQTNKDAELNYRALSYQFNNLGGEKFQIRAQLEGDSSYITLDCSQKSIGSGRLFTGETPTDSYEIDRASLNQACEDLLPSGFEAALLDKAKRLNPAITTESVLWRIQEMRKKQEAASTGVGKVRPKI